MIVTQQAAKTLAAFDRAVALAHLLPRLQYPVPYTLVIPLKVVVLCIRTQRP